MRVFVTGASGFIGSHTARLLVKEGCEVHALLRSSNSWRLADIVSSLHVLQAELADTPLIADYLKRTKPDLCIHMAWYGDASNRWTSLVNLDAVSDSIRFAQAAAEAGCKRLIGIGTCVEYDVQAGTLSEDNTPLKPESMYGGSKLALYTLLEQLGRATSMATAWARIFYLYGPAEDPQRLVPQVIQSLNRREAACATSGTQIRDYLHVEDVASAIWRIAQSDITGAVNVGSGEPISVADLVMEIGRLMACESLIELGAIPHRPGDPEFICADNSRLRMLGWKPNYSLAEGLQHTIDWWRAQASS